MKTGRVFVVGSLHYDIVLNAPSLPGRDETVMGDNIKFVCGGKGGNQAAAASQHGADVSFAGAVGRDFFADALLDNLQKADVETGQIIQCDTAASGLSVAIVDSNGDYGAVVASGANQDIDARLIRVPRDTRLLILQNEIPETTNLAVATDTRQVGGQVLLNAAPMRELSDELLRLVDVLIVNKVEAEALFDRPVKCSSDALAALQDHCLPCPAVIITLGGDGLAFHNEKTGPQHLAAQEVVSISSHGAGDAFTGALGARLVLGDELAVAIDYASTAAALHVSTPVEMRGTIDSNMVRSFL